MPKISKSIVDKDLRDRVFKDAIYDDNDEVVWHKVNDRQYGCILTDMNGDERYVRIGAIVAELRDDMTAEELMDMEIADYQAKQEKKEEQRAKAKAKAEADKAKREKKEEEVSES